jgi:hypothetical protein
VISQIGDIGAIFGAVAAAIVVTSTAEALWKNGPGRRRIWIRNFRRLTPGVRPAYVEQLFGQATFTREHTAKRVNLVNAAIEWVDEPLISSVWPLGLDGWVMTWSKDDAVVAYSLTTASRRFHPKIRMGVAIGPWHDDIRLGRTRFAELSSNPQKWAMSLGAHSYGYTEEHYFGNPGNYWTWYCGLCEVGYRKFFGQPFNGQSTDGAEPPDEAIRFRATTSINSVAIASAAAMDLQLYSPGPNSNHAFPLQGPGVRNSWRRRRLQRKVYGMARRPRLPS